jgi:hypothetical protein
MIGSLPKWAERFNNRIASRVRMGRTITAELAIEGLGRKKWEEGVDERIKPEKKPAKRKARNSDKISETSEGQPTE